MIIKKTHHYLQWLFWLFVAYLLITRVFISWVQFYPQQAINITQWLTDSEIQLNSIEIEQDWLGFQATLKDISIESSKFQFQANVFSADINTFSIFIPSIGYGDYLKISKGSYQNKVPAELEAINRTLSVDDFSKIDINISRLWKRVKLQDFVLNEVTRPGLSIQLHDFQSINASRLSIVSEFSLNYKDVFNYERFNFQSSFAANVWGGIETGEFSLSSFRPLQIEGLSKLLSLNWQKVLPQGELIVDLKGTVSQSQLSSMELNLNTQALSWRQQQEDLPVSLGLQLLWDAEHQNIQKQFKEWHFSLSKIQIDNRFIDAVSPMELYFETGEYLNFNAEYFDIEPFKVLVKSLITTPHVAALFDRTAYLNISNLSGKLNWETLDVPHLAIHFDRLDLPVTDYPGMSLQNFQIVKTPNEVLLSTPKPIWVMAPDIHSKPMKLALPKIVQFKLDSLNQAWQLNKTDLTLDSIPVSLSINQLTSAYIDSQFALNIETMSKVKEYLPYDLMSSNLKKWLTESLQGGEDVSVNGSVRGLFKDFPFAKGDGLFKVAAHVNNAKLKFNARWPMLQNFDADVIFTPFKIDIAVDSVNLGAGVVAKDVSVNIPDLDKHDIGLTVKGSVKTRLNSAIKYLAMSPLADKLGMQELFKEGAKFGGGSNILLDRIWVPISGYDNKAEEVAGSVVFLDSSIELFEKLKFQNIRGQLSFTDTGVSAKKLTYDVLQGKGSVKITTNTKTQKVTVMGNGHFLKDKNSWFSKPVPWNAKLLVPFKSAKDKMVNLNVVANISKAQSKLPEPLNNEALQNKQIELQATIAKGVVEAHANIPDLLESKLKWQDSGDGYALQQNQIAFGLPIKNVQSNIANESFIVGKINQFNLDDWMPLIKEANLFGNKPSKGIGLKLNNISASVKNTIFLSHDYTGLDIALTAKPHQPISVKVKSKDVDGQVFFENNDVIRVDLKHFQFFTDDMGGEDLSATLSKESMSCTEQSQAQNLLPKIILSAKNIKIDERKIDSIAFVVEDKKNNLSIQNITGNFGGKAGVLKSSYSFDKQKQKSILNAKLTSNDVAAVTEFIKLNKGFTGKSADVDIQLNWSGGLECFSTKSSQGSIRFKLEDGSVEDVEPGFARLIGLLSVESLVRRLKLDLKDVTNKGMIYDEIKGQAILNNGLLNLKDFTIKAPSASGVIKGQVDIIKQTFNLVAKITPKIGATIPTIAAIAGGTNPLAALAIYTLMKVIPGVNENLVTYEYKVNGPWTAPIINDNKPADGVKEEIFEESVLDLN
ncbi:YhdP family phospholipid transporter [Thiomicrorhabdus lithotrophica]|uniref:YhdP central domain-containing protein n=1 Tax=Thiomicrorhabdus lithotrophica TaxID=2949997 RepID=A0ABY8CDB3_9GAMM|nr:AsmA-like C-terminal region-containing protein [Thiomicrorhabdus lithotrophica]WEJ62118.1 hypothetical protein NR989_08860 [Thiomicrorhabdus lithotrophica]